MVQRLATPREPGRAGWNLSRPSREPRRKGHADNPRCLGGRSFSSDIRGAQLSGALAPEERLWRGRLARGFSALPSFETSNLRFQIARRGISPSVRLEISSRGAATVLSPARSAAECRESRNKETSPGGTTEVWKRHFGRDVKCVPVLPFLATSHFVSGGRHCLKFLLPQNFPSPTIRSPRVRSLSRF